MMVVNDSTKRKLISVVTINFNNRNGLQKTLNSVQEQLYNHYEHIIIDGGSNDGSVELIKSFSTKLSYWVSEPDSGIYHAMNKGIGAASGEYVQFLNSGDWLCSNDTLERISSSLYKEDIIFGNMIKVYPDGRMHTDKGPQRSILTLGDMYFDTINHSSAFIRRKLFDKYGLYDQRYKIVSDWAFFLKAIGLGDATVKYIDQDINYFDMTGISNAQLSLRYEERKKIVKDYIPQRLLPDYQQMDRLRVKAKIFDKIQQQSILWNLLRVYNKFTKNKLW